MAPKRPRASEPPTDEQNPPIQSNSNSDSDSESNADDFIAKPIVKNDTAKQQEEDDDDGEKKGLFNRVWSLSDEIILLQSMIDFKKAAAEEEEDKDNDRGRFYDFVKGKLRDGKFDKKQVLDKVKKLKKKYKSDLSRSIDGKDPEFMNTHDYKSFKLSRKIWDVDVLRNSNSAVEEVGNDSDVRVNVLALCALGNDNADKFVKRKHGMAKSAKKVKNVDKTENAVSKSMKKVKVLEKAGNFDHDGAEKKEKGLGELYPFLMKAVEGENDVPKVRMFEGFKGCLSMVDEGRLKEWNKKWKDVYVAEMNAYVQRVAVIREQAEWFSKSYKSS